MRAVVLVGGFGTRLRPLTSTTPKQMLPVVDRPMIEWVLEHLGRYGVEEAVLSLGYRPDRFTERYRDDVCGGVHLRYAVEPEPLDTAGAVGFAARSAGIEERFVVVNGDVLTDLDLSALVEFHERAGAEGTIHLTPVEDPSRYGVVPTDETGRVIDFVEKPARGEAPTNLINAGTYVLEPSVIERIPEGAPISIERVTFPAMAHEGTLYAWPSDDYWVDAGTPATYIQAQLDLVSGARAIRAAPTGSAEVAPSARVDRSVLMDGVVVGPGARVCRSVLLPAARVCTGASVSDSVIGPGAVIGEHAVVEEHTLVGEHEEVEERAHLRGARVPEVDG